MEGEQAKEPEQTGGSGTKTNRKVRKGVVNNENGVVGRAGRRRGDGEGEAGQP